MPYAPRAFGPPVFYTDLVVATSASGPTSSAPITGFSIGSPLIPIVFPASLPQSSWYMANGALLDVQPSVCTAPLPTGNTIPVGKAFILLFSTYTSNTQTHLADGSTVTMQFLLQGGQTATGLVQLSSSTVSNVLQVICTVVSTITLSAS